MKFIKDLHAWSLQWTETKWGAWALFICAFADASFLPLPTPLFFITLALLNVSKVYKYVIYGTMGSLFGAMFGYLIGYFAWLTPEKEFSVFAQFVFDNVPGFSYEVYSSVQAYYFKWDFWILFVASLMPLPYKLFSISSGVFNVNFIMFSIATFLSQGVKFYLLALLVLKIGPGVKKLLDFKIKPNVLIAAASIAVASIVIVFVVR